MVDYAEPADNMINQYEFLYNKEVQSAGSSMRRSAALPALARQPHAVRVSGGVAMVSTVAAGLALHHSYAPLVGWPLVLPPHLLCSLTHVRLL